MGNGRGRANYRVQYRGSRHAPVAEVIDITSDDELPTTEKIPRRKSDLSSDGSGVRTFETVVRIERRVDVASSESSEFAAYTTEFADRNRQFAVKNIGSMAVTYFAGHILRRALHERYPKYGNDLKATEDIQRGIRSSFGLFIQSALAIRREAERFDLLSEPYDRNPDDPPLAMPYNPMSDAWVTATGILKPSMRVLDSRYIVADLSPNQYLEEERAKISDYLRHDEGLKIDDRPYDGERIPHLTLSETRAEVLRSYPLDAAPLPYDVRLRAPELYAKIGTPLYM